MQWFKFRALGLHRDIKHGKHVFFVFFCTRECVPCESSQATTAVLECSAVLIRFLAGARVLSVQKHNFGLGTPLCSMLY